MAEEKTAGAPPAAAAPAPRKKPAARKSAAKKPAAPKAGSMEVAFAAIGRRADEARAKLATMTDEAAQAGKKSLDKATKATGAKLEELNRTWQKLPPKRKAQWIAGALGAIAAAVAVPIAVQKRRKSKKAKSEATDE